MAGAGPPALELTAEMVAHMRATRGPGPSMATAHQHLMRWRAAHNSDSTEYVDLTHVTDAELFDWRLWLACRPDWEMVVGNGVWAFWFVGRCSRDTNLLDYRGDFLVRRINKSSPEKRLHPQQANQRKNHELCGFFDLRLLGILALGRIRP